MKKRIAVLILAVLMAASVLGGCASGKVDASKYATTAFATIDGEKIYMDELNYYLRTTQYMYEEWGYLEYMGAEKWDDEISYYNLWTEIPGESLKQNAVTTVRQAYVLSKEAEKAGLALTADEAAKVEAAADEFLSSSDAELLAAVNISRDRLVEIYTRNALANKMYADYTATVDTTVSDEDACQYDVSYIFVSTTKLANVENLAEDATPETVANAIVEAINNGKTKEEALEPYGDALSFTAVTMGDGDNSSTYGAAAEELAVGQAGSVSYGSDGAYYVVVRDSDYNEEATEAEKEDMADDIVAEAFAAVYAEWEAAYSFEPDYDLIDGIVVSETIYVAPETEADTTAETESVAETTAAN